MNGTSEFCLGETGAEKLLMKGQITTNSNSPLAGSAALKLHSFCLSLLAKISATTTLRHFHRLP